jgi:hypothetical protein
MLFFFKYLLWLTILAFLSLLLCEIGSANYQHYLAHPSENLGETLAAAL